MSRNSPFERLERLMVGQRESTYRQFVRAITVVTAALVLAWVLARFGVAGLDPGLADLFGPAAAVAVALYVAAGLAQVVVLARAYDRGAAEVAQTAAELEEAADAVKETAEQVDESAETVERAAKDVDDAAGQVDEAVEQASEAREGVDDAKETADAVKEAVEQEKERLPDADESEE